MFGVVPLFGLASAGVAIGGRDGACRSRLPLGDSVGLFVGKQIGVFGAIWLSDRDRHGAAPRAIAVGARFTPRRCCAASASR